jgi:Polysaccharide lyase
VALLVLACIAPTAYAAGRRDRRVQDSDRAAGLALGDLAGRSLRFASVAASGEGSHRVVAVRVRRAAARACRHGRLLRARSRAAAAGPSRTPMKVRVRTRTASPVPPAQLGGVVWKADAEASMASEWASSASLPAAASPPSPDASRIAQSSFSVQGERSYRFEMRDGDGSYGRAELGQAMPATAGFENRLFRAGEERWIAMQYYFPSTWPTADTWQTVLQIKPVTSGAGGPTIGLDAGRNRLLFAGNTSVWGSTAGNVLDGAGPLAGHSYPLTRGRWIKLTWHVVFSADPAAGSLEVFGDLADGQGMRTLVPRRTRATMKYLGGAADPVHLRIGIYRDPAIRTTQSLYVDGVTVATTRAAAEANAYCSA